MCQGLLRASYGMNYIDFLDLITKILQRRRDLIQGKVEAVRFDGCDLGKSHCLYDLGKIRDVLQKLCCDFSNLDMTNKERDCLSLLDCLTDVDVLQ